MSIIVISTTFFTATAQEDSVDTDLEAVDLTDDDIFLLEDTTLVPKRPGKSTQMAGFRKHESPLDNLLANLDLPAGLMQVEESINGHQRLFVSEGPAEALVIGSTFADELERIGFEIQATSHSQALAISEAGNLGLAIYPTASEVEGNSTSLDGIAKDAVVVEIWLEEQSDPLARALIDAYV